MGGVSVIQRTAIAVSLGLALAAGGYLKGRVDGAALADAAHAAAIADLQDDLFRTADRASELGAALLAAQAGNAILTSEFEDNARADPSAAARRPDPVSLRELSDLFARQRATP
jgi:hypothetical protein